MDLVRSWIAGIAAFLAADLGITYVTVNVTTREWFTSTSGTIIWNAVSGFLVYMVAVLFAAIFHRAPYRHDPRRHALAVLTIPAAIVLYSAAYALFSGVITGTVVSVVAGIAGTSAAWAMTAWRRSHRAKSLADDSGYF
jgi:hypothetical protein